MMIRVQLTRWIHAPPLTGRVAFLWGALLIALPTGVRAAVSGSITGCEFTPYLPFVLLAAVLLPWWLAGAIALVSVAILGGLFVHPLHDTACFLSAAGLFLASSGLIIGAFVLIRCAVAAIQARGADESEGGIIFSLEKGEVWASWYGQGPPMLLGSQKKVSAMMEDFLAQVELGKSLNRQR